jgi:sec-independent protein translocase protein TatB
MFDFAWSEIALIAGVALVLIGPKDMPVAIRTVTSMIKKARRMAGEFQTHVDEMVREANLEEVRSQINEIRNFDFRGHVEKAVDPDGSLRTSFSDPFVPSATPTQTVEPLPEVTVSEPPAVVAEAPAPDTPAEPAKAKEVSGTREVEDCGAPAFVPPNLVPRPKPKPVARAPEAPAFIPPSAVLQDRSQPTS